MRIGDCDGKGGYSFTKPVKCQFLGITELLMAPKINAFLCLSAVVVAALFFVVRATADCDGEVRPSAGFGCANPGAAGCITCELSIAACPSGTGYVCSVAPTCPPDLCCDLIQCEDGTTYTPHGLCRAQSGPGCPLGSQCNAYLIEPAGVLVADCDEED